MLIVVEHHEQDAQPEVDCGVHLGPEHQKGAVAAHDERAYVALAAELGAGRGGDGVTHAALAERDGRAGAGADREQMQRGGGAIAGVEEDVAALGEIALQDLDRHAGAQRVAARSFRAQGAAIGWMR